MAVRSILCVFLLTIACSNAYVFWFASSCGARNYNWGQTDPIMNTWEGYEMMLNYGKLRLVATQSFDDRENSHECLTMEMDWSIDPPTWNMNFTMADGTPRQESGTMTVTYGPPATRMLFDGVPADLFMPYGGNAWLFPAYMSETELVLVGCYDALLSSYDTLYVFTNQDIESLDESCALANIHSSINRNYFNDVRFKNNTNC